MPDDRIKVKSVYKAMRVLECFNTKQPLSITEISETLGIYKSNVFDILSTFLALNYVTKNEESNKYYLGPSAVRLGRAAAITNNLQNLAVPALNRLAGATGEIAYLTVPIGYQVFYLNAIYPKGINVAEMGEMMLNTSEPMHLTSNGKAMLSYMPEAFINDYLSTPLQRNTEFSITDPDKLRDELYNSRLRGYAVDEQENTIGLRCVGVPILQNGDEVVGAISVSGSISHITRDKIEVYACLLKKAAAEIAMNL